MLTIEHTQHHWSRQEPFEAMVEATFSRPDTTMSARSHHLTSSLRYPLAVARSTEVLGTATGTTMLVFIEPT